jgi:pimeloyl-ACP methyl ester carboxylesterase
VIKLLVAAALAALAAPLPAAPSPASASATKSDAAVRMDHISIIKLGCGSPVVLIPGLASPRAVWDGIAPQLGKHHTVYLVQVNGFAGDDPGSNLKAGILDGIVSDLAAFMDREGIARAPVIGHSMGGLAGLMFAKAHPDKVERLMMVDSLPFFAVLLARGDEEPTTASIEPVARMMRDQVAARYGKPASAESAASDVASLALKAESRTTMAAWAAAADPRVTAQALYEDVTTDLRPSLASIKTPLTVMVPWSSAAFGKDRTLAFYARQYSGAPSVEYVDIAEAGYFVMLDQPESFGSAVDGFLNGAAQPR